jgi:hypothetical protein
MESMTSGLRDLTNSFLSLSTAASLFGATQLVRLLDVRSPRAGAADVSHRLDSVTEATTDQLSGWASTAFGRTDVFQRSAVDFMFDLATLNASGLLAASGPILNPLESALNPVVSGLDRMMPGADIELRWLELKNKIEIYFLVENAATRLRLSPVEYTPLPELVGRAYALGPFLALWAIEGLGHAYGQQAIEKNQFPRGLLTGPEADACPSASLLMLHAGIGLAFAEKLLAPMTASISPIEVRAMVAEFVRLCRENSQPGYVGAAYESLGLFTWEFHQELVCAVDRELQQSAPALLGYFWHGAGRAIYFAPQNFLPCADIDWAHVADSAPHAIGRLNIIAGLAWATTLVNMRQPEIQLNLLRLHGEVLRRMPAFGNGVRSSIVMRYDTTPHADLIARFCDCSATQVDADQRDHLASDIADACRDAIRCIYPALRQSVQLDEVFRYHDLDALVTSIGTHPIERSRTDLYGAATLTEADRMT